MPALVTKSVAIVVYKDFRIVITLLPFLYGLQILATKLYRLDAESWKLHVVVS